MAPNAAKAISHFGLTVELIDRILAALKMTPTERSILRDQAMSGDQSALFVLRHRAYYWGWISK